MLYRLIFLSGPNTGQQQTVLRPSMTVGSGSDCGVCIADDEMASRHAIFEHDDAGLLIRDLGTMHKIIVNHHQIETCRLKHGDEIEIGRTRFLLQATVRAEVNSAGATDDTERKKRRLSSKTLIYIIMGLAIVYLFARMFLTLPEPDYNTLAAPAEASTGISMRTFTASNHTQAIASAFRTNATVRLNSTTNRTIPPPLPGFRTNKTVILPIPIESNTTQVIVTQLVSTARTPPSVPVIFVPVPTNRTAACQPTARPSVPKVKIISTELNKFPSTDSYQEMRTLTIKLQQTSIIDIETDSVTIEVVFYDRNAETGDVFPSRMIVPQNPIKVAGPWNQEQQKVTTATYTVPNTSTSIGASRPQFRGFTIRLFQDGVLQDLTCKPADLRTFMPK